MGNCSAKEGVNESFSGCVRVFTDSGQVLSFQAPKSAKEILENYQGYDIYSQDCPCSPLSGEEILVDGKVCFLLPQGKPAVLPNYHHRVQQRILKSPMDDAGAMPRQQSHGVWKVKLVIPTKDLEEILAEEADIEAVISRLRSAAAASQTRRWVPSGKISALTLC